MYMRIMLRNNFGLQDLSGHRSALFGVGPMIYRTRFYHILSVLPSVLSIHPPLEAPIVFCTEMHLLSPIHPGVLT